MDIFQQTKGAINDLGKGFITIDIEKGKNC